MTAVPEQFQRIAFAKESSFKTAGTWVNAKGLLSPVTISPDRETIALDVALNSYGDVYAGVPGRQKYSASFSYMLTFNAYADLKTLFTAALGSENSATTLTFSSTQTNVGVNISAGGPATWIKVTGNDSKTYFVPVDTSAANLVTYGVSLPSGVTTTACSNPSANSGGCFDYSQGLACDTFSIESDWSAKPDSYQQQVILAKGACLSSCQLVYEKDKVLAMSFAFSMAAEYTKSGGAATNISNPGVWSGTFLGWAGDTILEAPSQGTGASYQINNGAGYAAGSTTVAVDTGTGTILVGDTVTFNGVTGTYVVTAALSSGSFSFQPGLAGSVADNAAVTLVGTPTWSTAKKSLRKLELELNPQVIADTGSNGLDGGASATATLPGSDIKGYVRGPAFKGLLTVLVEYDVRHYTRFDAQVPYKFAHVMYPGVPNGAAIGAQRACLYVRRLIPQGFPVVVTDGDLRCHQLTFQVERDLTTNGVPERVAFALFN